LDGLLEAKMEGGKRSTKILRPEDGKPIKVSKFKSEFNDKTSSPSFSKPTILGEVKEVPSSHVVKDIISFSSNGFPKPSAKKNLNLGSKSLSNPGESQSKRQDKAEEESEKPRLENVSYRNETAEDFDKEISDQNLKEVLSMSAEEVAASIAQLSTMFSSQNLDFLRSRGSQSAVGSSNSMTKPKHSRFDESMNTENKPYIAKDAQELVSQVKSAPSHIRRALQWTLDEDEEEEDTPGTDVSESSKSDLLPQKVSTPKLTKSPRFDLQGCRIIHSGITAEGKPLSKSSQNEPPTVFHECMEILQKSFLGRLLSPVELENLIMFCIAKLLDCGFVVEIPLGDGGVEKWIPELEHHEFDQGSPGYNLLEACEVFFPSLLLPRYLTPLDSF
jgi:hypothetical protein